MALDRQSIERRDFPIARRGYDPEAVDAHLARVAGELDALKGEAAQSPESLASITGAKVASIVEAAEQSAAAIERAAQEQAESARRDAEREASKTREDALEKSRAHVHKVAEAAGLISDRIDAMDSELRSLAESLRAGAQRLQADLALLSGNIEDLYGSTTAPASQPARAPAPEPVAEEPLAEEAPQLAEEAVEEATGDVEGARLIALNMALNGTSREETDRYLAENFDLADRSGLLDEVYSSVEG